MWFSDDINYEVLITVSNDNLINNNIIKAEFNLLHMNSTTGFRIIPFHNQNTPGRYPIEFSTTEMAFYQIIGLIYNVYIKSV